MNVYICLIFLNALAGEGADHSQLYIPDSDAMVNTVADNCNMADVINALHPCLLGQWVGQNSAIALLRGFVLILEALMLGSKAIDLRHAVHDSTWHGKVAERSKARG
ncbi:hypothetical protein BDW68DRAFT_179707 [Aspergillus falconensis]